MAVYSIHILRGQESRQLWRYKILLWPFFLFGSLWLHSSSNLLPVQIVLCTRRASLAWLMHLVVGAWRHVCHEILQLGHVRTVTEIQDIWLWMQLRAHYVQTMWTVTLVFRWILDIWRGALLREIKSVVLEYRITKTNESNHSGQSQGIQTIRSIQWSVKTCTCMQHTPNSGNVRQLFLSHLLSIVI